jgi:hypothetical protein
MSSMQMDVPSISPPSHFVKNRRPKATISALSVAHTAPVARILGVAGFAKGTILTATKT